MKIFLFTCLLLAAALAQSQTIKGTVLSATQEPLIGASVVVQGTTNGTITGMEGEFELSMSLPGSLVISYVGYLPDTLHVHHAEPLVITLRENNELAAVVVESSSTFIDNREPILAQIITEKELLKAACCNLSESFETTASVDVSFTDAVTGTKMIKMLGLDGKYTMINRENMPAVRGLSSRLGLNYIPGTWLQSIDVGKGAGTVVNGYESMTGQINLEFKKPESSEQLYLNGYVNDFGRLELNANTAYRLNDQWTGALLTHFNYFNNERDINDDGFLDLPKGRQINLLNRYKYEGERVMSQIGLQVMHDERAGGQLGFGFGDHAATSSLYGYANTANKVELFGKTALLFPETPYKGWGWVYSYTYQDQVADFGRRRYTGRENTLYTNVIHQNIIGSSFHQIKTGGGLLVDLYRESFADSAYQRDEVVPGAFFEYSYLPNDKISWVNGLRVDWHNLYGLYVTPRMHFRYAPSEASTLRVSAGRGYRTVNIIPENNQVFVSSRELVVAEELMPEESWNIGGSLVQHVHLGERNIELVADYYYTTFVNQVIADMDGNPGEIRFYNLNGQSNAHSFQLEASTKVSDHVHTKAAYKRYDIKSHINGVYQSQPFVSNDRFFWNWSYASRFDIWQVDFTFQWYGRQRMPDTSLKPVDFQMPAYSPDFTNINAQISRAFRWGNVYLGGENILDFRQEHPILDHENPFGPHFDGSMVWGPVAGRMIYAGFRYKIK